MKKIIKLTSNRHNRRYAMRQNAKKHGYIFVCSTVIISVSVGPFNEYITRTAKRLSDEDPDNVGHDNWERLGLTALENTAWQDANEEWIGPNGNDGLYAAYTSRAVHTEDVTAEVNNFIAAFRLAARPVLAGIAANSKCTETDAVVFNFVRVVDRKKPIQVETEITDLCYSLFVYKANGKYKVKNRRSNDAKRASVCEHANGVEYRWIVLDNIPNNNAPTDPDDDRLETTIYSGATQDINAGSGNVGKRLYVWTRYINNTYKNEEKQGPFGQRMDYLIGVS